jgi:hypothetical protein
MRRTAPNVAASCSAERVQCDRAPLSCAASRKDFRPSAAPNSMRPSTLKWGFCSWTPGSSLGRETSILHWLGPEVLVHRAPAARRTQIDVHPLAGIRTITSRRQDARLHFPPTNCGPQSLRRFTTSPPTNENYCKTLRVSAEAAPCGSREARGTEAPHGALRHPNRFFCFVIMSSFKTPEPKKSTGDK